MITFSEEEVAGVMQRLNQAAVFGDLNVARHLVPVAELIEQKMVAVREVAQKKAAPEDEGKH